MAGASPASSANADAVALAALAHADVEPDVSLLELENGPLLPDAAAGNDAGAGVALAPAEDLPSAEGSTDFKPVYGTVEDILANSPPYFKHFWKVLLLIGLYYLLPSVQFISFQAETGAVHCYYNYKCKHDYNGIPAFNNVVSNAAYLVAGLGFMAMVYFIRPAAQSEHTGLHTDRSLYYSLGIVMCLEGVFSSLYHMCPSRLNFQFDSAFMITGIALLMVALFQKRHATRTVGAIRFYAWIGVLNLINALTAFTGTITAATWVFVFTALGTMMVQGSLHLYYHKRWTLSRRTPRRVWRGLASCRPRDPARLVMLLVVNAATAAVAIVGATRVTQFSDYVLCVFFVDLLIYFVYYLGAKYYYGERVGWHVLYLLMLELALAGIAVVYFQQAVSDKLLTPEESRELNRECILFDYFDSHDVWHFLSAAAVFVLAVLIWSLDRGIEHIPRSQLHVF